MTWKDELDTAAAQAQIVRNAALSSDPLFVIAKDIQCRNLKLEPEICIAKAKEFLAAYKEEMEKQLAEEEANDDSRVG